MRISIRKLRARRVHCPAHNELLLARFGQADRKSLDRRVWAAFLLGPVQFSVGQENAEKCYENWLAARILQIYADKYG